MTNLEWGRAACSEEEIQECVAAGAFHPGEVIEWRAPVKDETPTLSTLEDQFVILSLKHIFCGLRLDASDFLVSVLNHYRVEWSHLTPNSITALSMFAHLCEAYMGLPPTLEVLTHFYSLFRNMKGETTTVGSVYFRLRDRMRKKYPFYYLKASQFYWVSQWFYAKVPQSCRLTFRCDALEVEEKNNWRDLLPLSREQQKQVLTFTELSNKGLTGADIIHDYLKHRISPLRRRTHLACNYSGPSDPTRDSDEDLSMEDIESKLCYLLNSKKMGVTQPTDRPNVPTSLIRASVNDHANQPLSLLNVPSTHGAKKNAYKSPVRHASLRRSTRQSAGPRKVVVPPPLEIDPSPTQDFDPEEEILDVVTNITTSASPNQGIEQKSIEHPAEVKEGEMVSEALSTFKELNKDKSFTLIHCWDMLKGEDKWKAKMKEIAEQKRAATKKQKVHKDSTLTNVEENNNEDVTETQAPESEAQKRPQGQKKANEALRQGGVEACVEALDIMWAKKEAFDMEKEKKKDERFMASLELEKKKEERLMASLELEKKRLSLEEKKAEMDLMKEEDKIMSMDMTSLTPLQKQYYLTMQEKIVARRLAN